MAKIREPDDHRVSRATKQNNLRKAIDQLYGLCAGLAADGRLTDDEIALLDAWLREHRVVQQHFPGNAVAERVQAILEDGVITDDERSDLLETLQAIVGGSFEEHGTVAGLATRLPVDNVDAIQFDGRVFVFTGKFAFGRRARCAAAVIERGGLVEDSVTRRVNYLVIGSMASRDWAHTSHGRKIERALQLKRNGAPLIIVAEEAWVRHLSAAS